MKGYKEAGFQDRAKASATAKDKLLEKFKAAPKPDEAVVAERAARKAEREAKEAAKREAVRAARELAQQEKLEKARLAQEAAAAAAVAAPAPLTEAERKAARDARYAARKGRK